MAAKNNVEVYNIPKISAVLQEENQRCTALREIKRNDDINI